MIGLEKAIRAPCFNSGTMSLPHSNVRIEAHTVLASFFASSHPPKEEKVIEHCQAGLDLSIGRERLFPNLVATLHALKARILVNKGDSSRISEAISHAKAAQVALYACNERRLQYEVCVTLGDAYATCREGTICGNLSSACESYMSAIQLSRMAALETPTNVMWLSCRVVQLMLLFLRHKRAGGRPAPSSKRSGSDPCQANIAETCGMQPRGMSLNELLMLVGQLRLDMENLREEDLEGPDKLEQLDSCIFECTGKAYFEKARTCPSTRVQDLRRAMSEMQHALNSCSWKHDPAGQRRSAIREIIDDIRMVLEQAEEKTEDAAPLTSRNDTTSPGGDFRDRTPRTLLNNLEQRRPVMNTSSMSHVGRTFTEA